MIRSEIETVKGLRTETYSSYILCRDWDNSGKMQGAEMHAQHELCYLCEMVFAEAF